MKRTNPEEAKNYSTEHTEFLIILQDRNIEFIDYFVERLEGREYVFSSC